LLQILGGYQAVFMSFTTQEQCFITDERIPAFLLNFHEPCLKIQGWFESRDWSFLSYDRASGFGECCTCQLFSKNDCFTVLGENLCGSTGSG
jgi:hypothetical protein